MLRQLLANLHHFLRQLTHRKAVFRLLGGGEIQVKNIIQRGDEAVHLFTVLAQPLRNRQRRRGFRTELLHAGCHQFAEQIQLQAKPRGGNFRAHLQRISRHVGQMMAFIEHQQQVFGLRQDRFTLQCSHDQRVVGDNHLRFLNLTPGDKERALAIVVTVTVQAACFIGAEPAPQVVADRLVGVIPQAVPLVAVEIGLQLCALLLLRLVVWRQLVIKKREQILLGGFTAGQSRQIARTDVAPATKGGGKP